MDTLDITKYGFVVDTNSYAGNFHRDLFAYAAGILPLRVKEDKWATRFCEETGTKPEQNAFEDISLEVEDPSGIWDAENSDSAVVYFKEKPTDEMIDLMKNRARIFCDEQGILIVSFQLLEFSVRTQEI